LPMCARVDQRFASAGDSGAAGDVGVDSDIAGGS
jgi:hypothetical protein